MDPSRTQTPSKPSPTRRIIHGFFFLLIISAAVLSVIFRIELQDIITGMRFEPTVEIATLRDRIQLTPRAERIFNASNPQLHDREDFVHYCPNNNPYANILGCFSAQGTIHVYNITMPELNGIQESTLAHEFLHAVYARHSAATLAWLNPLLRQAYEDNREALADAMQFYDEHEYLNEIHSRLGTEILHLPAELENYFARYFRDRTTLVGFFQQYHGHLVAMRAESERQLAEIEALGEIIDSQREEYITGSANLNTAIIDFNARVAAGQLSTSQFYAERATLTAEGDRLDALFRTLNSNISEYNDLIHTYNQNALHLRQLNDAMSSAPREGEDSLPGGP